MTASRDLSNTSNNYIVSEIVGDSTQDYKFSYSVSINPPSVLPYMLQDKYRNKSISSLECIFAPFQSKSGEIYPTMPFLRSGTYNDINGYRVAVTTTIDNETADNEEIFNNTGDELRTVGVRLPMYCVGFGYDVYGEVVPKIDSARILSINNNNDYVEIGRANHNLSVDDEIYIQNCTVNKYNRLHKVTDIPSSDRFITDVLFTDSATDGDYYLASNIEKYANTSNTKKIVDKNNITRWKAGPVDLAWDEEAGVWTGNNNIYGFLASDITKASGRLQYTEFDMFVYQKNELTIDDIADNNGKLQLNLSSHNLQDSGYIYITQSTDELKYIGSHQIKSVIDDYSVLLDSDYESPSSDLKYYMASKVKVRNYDTHYSLQLKTKCEVDEDGNCSNKDEDVLIVAFRRGGYYIPIYIGHPND